MPATRLQLKHFDAGMGCPQGQRPLQRGSHMAGTTATEETGATLAHTASGLRRSGQYATSRETTCSRPAGCPASRLRVLQPGAE